MDIGRFIKIDTKTLTDTTNKLVEKVKLFLKPFLRPVLEPLFHHGIKRIKWIWYAFITFFTLGILYFSLIAINPFNLFGKIPSLKVLENPKSDEASELISEDGVILGKYFRSNRTPIPYDSISKKVVNTLLATEDIRYFDHSGIDLKGILSIGYYLIKGDRRGASTITQQLAKNLYRTRKKESEGTLYSSSLATLIIKSKEWMTAVKIERAYTKKEIITMYLNTVDFGSNSFGIKVASQTFFGKNQKDLDWEEAAMLIGLLKAPTLYSPIINPKNALVRRNTVLNQLTKYDFISKEEGEKLKSEEIALEYNVENQNQGLAPYFRTEASKYLRSWCEENGYDLYDDGLKIYTTVNSKMQISAENAVAKHMKYLQNHFFKEWGNNKPWMGVHKREKIDRSSVAKDPVVWNQIRRTDLYYNLVRKYGKDDTTSIIKELNTPKEMQLFTWNGITDSVMTPLENIAHHLRYLQTGFLSMNPKNGFIKAWVGGINYRFFKYDHVKLGKRQPGSCFKPIVYATVLEEAGDVYSPCYKAVDEPVTFVVGTGKKSISQLNETNDALEGNIWTPKNADNKYSGDTLTLRQALARSVNSVTALMMKSLGDHTPSRVLDYARKLGFTSDIDAVPAMALGVFDVSIYEMVGAYGTFLNKGTWVEPIFISRIEDKYGNVIANFSAERKKVLSEQTAYKMLYMLQGGVQEKGGTGLAIHSYGKLTQGQEIGTKTGTTQNSSDGWFMCVTPDLVTGCWVGGDHRLIRFKSIYMGQGARMALPIVGNYLKDIYADSTLALVKRPFEKPKDMESLSCSKKDSDQNSSDSDQNNVFSIGESIDDELE